MNSILKGLWTPPVRAVDPATKIPTKNVRSQNSGDSNSSIASSNSGTLPTVPSGSADAPAPVPVHPSAAAAAAAAMAAVLGGGAPRDSSPPAAPLDPAQVVSLALSKLPSTSLPSVPSGGSSFSLGHSASMSGAHSAAQVARLQQELEALKVELQQVGPRWLWRTVAWLSGLQGCAGVSASRSHCPLLCHTQAQHAGHIMACPRTHVLTRTRTLLTHVRMRIHTCAHTCPHTHALTHMTSHTCPHAHPRCPQANQRVAEVEADNKALRAALEGAKAS